MAKKINEKMKEIKKDLLLEEASKLFETVGYENMKIGCPPTKGFLFPCVLKVA